MTPHASRHLDWQGCLNVRDLGGLPLPGGGTTRWRSVVRADRIAALTPDGWSALADHGVRTVVDLRTAEERSPAEAGARPSDVRVVEVSILLEADPDWVARTYTLTGHARELYGHILDGCAGTFADAASAIATADEGAVVVHCHAGRDRTGLLCAMLLDLVGVPRETIAEDYALSEERLDGVVPCTPDTMLWALDRLDAGFGGVEGYLLAGGTDERVLAALRARLAA